MQALGQVLKFQYLDAEPWLFYMLITIEQ